jgi:hypothetical protein
MLFQCLATRILTFSLRIEAIFMVDVTPIGMRSSLLSFQWCSSKCNSCLGCETVVGPVRSRMISMHAYELQ